MNRRQLLQRACALLHHRGRRPAGVSWDRRPRAQLAEARANARDIARAVRTLRAAVPASGSYVSEAGYFDPGWRRAYWGANYDRLRTVKRKYDAEGLFIVHHGVGSEDWSADGNTRLRT